MGIVCVVVIPLIEQSTTSPTIMSQMFSNYEDNQTALTIHVIRGERKQASQNKSLGRFDLADIPSAPRGMPQIEVTFDIDANGILNVSAKDKATGKEQSIVIKASSGLSDDEIEKMVQDAEANAEADQKFEELVTARNTLDGLIHATKKTLEEAGDKATEEEKTAIQAALTEAEEVVKGDDKEKIEAATKSLTDTSGELAQKMYAEQAAQAQAGEGAQAEGAQTEAEPAADEGVGEAECEEVKEEK